MAEPPLDFHTNQLAEVVQRFFYLRPRLKIVLPEDLAKVKAHLEESRPGDNPPNATDFSLLFNIGVVLTHHQEPMTMGDLSRALDVPLSTATRIVDWLVKNAYAERLPDPEDRRIVRVSLTEAGQEMYRAVNTFMRNRLEKLLLRFDPAERDTLVAMLHKLVAALEEEV